MNRRDRASMERVVASVARDVEPLLGDLVFVGGVTTGLLVTDPATATVPATDDVDVVVEVATRSEYDSLSERLRNLGLRHDTTRGAPVCRWITPTAGLRLDVMPSEAAVLGFANPWYGEVLRTAEDYELEPGLVVRIVAATSHLATKWAAHRERGADDPLASRDLEDIVVLVAGRPELVEEVAEARPELREWVASESSRFLDTEEADYVLEGNLPDARTVPDLVDTVRRRLERIAGLSR